MFITLDGIDGGGKSTQIGLLKDWLLPSGPVVSVRDPGSTAPGEAIRGLLLDSDLEMHRRTEALLYMAARSQLVEERIRPALENQATVLSDRFLLANVVYQSVGGNESVERLWDLGQLATDGLQPDLTILLDLPAELAITRLKGPADRMESRGVEYLEKVRQAFLSQLSRSGPHHVIVDATQSIQAMHNDIIEAVQSLKRTMAKE
ncbi:Thymidylate kinase [Roseimaritima multifibrata]|uniref:Thymidylate kinase n=1 Tax=Roseimaritima multifibrata TaxID=1930274 RepID=A0A517MFC6_9BACT|nr:dTMP kinase [Roseimaritima multifibrata]QDS93591.1 Thymidylate kinase [Roseimaritima multifibrata]